MKILIAISSKEYSGSTLGLGMKVASALKASTTIVDVGEKINEFGSKDVNIVNQLIETWDFDRPGVDVLEWAHDFLAKNNFIEIKADQSQLLKNKLIESETDRAEVFLKGKVGNNLNLILRNGDIIGELRSEVELGGYNITIIGGSKKRSMSHDLIQYINSSIFIVKNYNPRNEYELLMVIDESPNIKKVLRYGVRIAREFSIRLTLIFTKNSKISTKDYENSIKYVNKLLRRCKVNYSSHIKNGDLEEEIINASSDKHIIMMGASGSSPITKFFKGSIPLNIMNRCECPILIVK